jgi:hypothetical protein
MMLEILNNSEESDYCDPFLSKMTYSQKFVVKWLGACYCFR